MRTFLKKITYPFFKLSFDWYFSKPREYRFEDSSVMVHPSVFPPHLTLSTKIVLEFISAKELTGKTFLELGCGSGIIAIHAAKKGAIVTASDINKTALNYLKKAAVTNEVTLSIIESDLFKNIKQTSFDFIIINPPYYPRNPKSTKEMAWFCGENFEYFENLFFQISNYLFSQNEIYMILSEDCELEKIKAIALKNAIAFELILEKKVMGEKNYIFQLQKL